MCSPSWSLFLKILSTKKLYLVCIHNAQNVTNLFHAVFFILGSGSNTETITTNNTEILITDIGEEAQGGLPSLTCRTDLTACCRGMETGSGGVGQWTYPDGSVILNNAGSTTAGQPCEVSTF